MSQQTPRTGSPVAERRRIVIITGLSGAGKSNALQAFEDAGYFCIDNLPPRMIPAVMETVAQGTGTRRGGRGRTSGAAVLRRGARAEPRGRRGGERLGAPHTLYRVR